VYEGDGEPCDRSPLTVTSSDTYLANVVTLKSRRGSSSCPWLIRVSSGQTVNLTLIDFAARNNQQDSVATCQIYADMYIGSAKEPKTICSRGARERVLHTHTGRQDIRIAIESDQTSQQASYFLLRVEGKQLV